MSKPNSPLLIVENENVVRRDYGYCSKTRRNGVSFVAEEDIEGYLSAEVKITLKDYVFGIFNYFLKKNKSEILYAGTYTICSRNIDFQFMVPVKHIYPHSPILPGDEITIEIPQLDENSVENSIFKLSVINPEPAAQLFPVKNSGLMNMYEAKKYLEANPKGSVLSPKQNVYVLSDFEPDNIGKITYDMAFGNWTVNYPKVEFKTEVLRVANEELKVGMLQKYTTEDLAPFIGKKVKVTVEVINE